MDYYVKFTGYSAVFQNREEEIHAIMDFMTDETRIFIRGGKIVIRNTAKVTQSDVLEFVDRLKKPTSVANGDRQKDVSATSETQLPNIELEVFEGSDRNRVLRSAKRRIKQIGRIIGEVYELGRNIERRPYAEFIQEGERLGEYRVELHGMAVFNEGNLEGYYPLNLIFAHTPNEESERLIRRHLSAETVNEITEARRAVRMRDAA